jgi:hypothetical protein
MKNKWFDFIVLNKNHWGNGWTLKRLSAVRFAVLNDNNFMFDLLERHGGKDLMPEQMKEKDKEMFSHCIGNFSCNIHYKMIEVNIPLNEFNGF